LSKSGNLKFISSPHFWIVLFLLAVCVVLHYPQQILGITSPSLFSFIGLSRHAIERIILLIPVCYTGFVFGMRAGFVCLAAASAIMFPRVFLLSEYFPDALLETILIIVVGALINFWINGFKKEREQRQQILLELNSANIQLQNRTANLEVSERKYRELFEYAHDAIWEQDLEGNITNANYAFEAISGYNREEFIGKSVKVFMDEESVSLAGRIKRSLFAGEAIEQPYEQRMIKKDGTVAILQMATSLEREEGRPAGYLHIARDVTRRDQLSALLNIMEEGIAMIGQDRKILFMNPSLTHEFGDWKGEYCYKVFQGLDQPCEVCRFNTAILGTTQKREWTAGNGNVYEIVYTPFTNIDQTPGILSTFINITRRKKIERELVRLNDLKSELLDQKTAQLKEISQEVAKLEAEKIRFVRFLGVVAHDLKSPLSVSQSIVNGILEGYYGPVADEQKGMLERVTRRIDGLNALINDLVDIPLIETGQLVREMAEISLGEIIQNTVSEINVLAIEKGLQVGLLLPSNLPKVRGSSRRLQQVMQNLLSNAVKYSDSGVVLVRASENDDIVKVEVSDNGIGIPPEDQNRLFEDFFRGKNSGVAKGTGLGLSISRRIIEAHGGRIWVESPNPETNSGSKFNFTLPKYQGNEENPISGT
jgi:PAS domain S-box-containing protein